MIPMILGINTPTWHTQAACHPDHGYDPDLWFPHPSNRTQSRLAIAICTNCPVQTQCLKDAITHKDLGIRGATTEYARRPMNNPQAKAQHAKGRQGICTDCGGPTTRKIVTRCRPCYNETRKPS